MPTSRLKKSVTLVFLAPVLSVLIAQVAVRAADAKTPPSAVERGRHLVETSACSDCHTPMKFDEKLGMPVPDRERFLSGHPAGAPVAKSLPEGAAMAIGATATSFRLPFGVVYAANLTPDATGLEGWTEEMFLNAMRTGRHMGGTGRPIYPPMPWSAFRNFSDADLKAIYAFLRTLPKVRNEVPDNEVAPPAEGAILKLNQAIAAH